MDALTQVIFYFIYLYGYSIPDTNQYRMTALEIPFKLLIFLSVETGLLWVRKWLVLLKRDDSSHWFSFINWNFRIFNKDPRTFYMIQAAYVYTFNFNIKYPIINAVHVCIISHSETVFHKLKYKLRLIIHQY